MDRRSFFALPLTAVLGAEFKASIPITALREAPKPGTMVRAPAGAIEIIVGGEVFHCYLWKPE